jgi:DNA-binding NarL/FixJ family response regulator
MPNKIKIAIVDDHKLFRDGIATLLSSFPDLSISIVAGNGREFFAELLTKKRPIDILILDVEMPEMDGIEVLKKLKDTQSDIKPLLLTQHSEDELVYGLVELGAKGLLHKSADIEDVVDAIYSLKNNELYFNDEVSKLVLRKLVKKEHIKRIGINKNLTEKEKEIIRLICHEFTTKEIADKLFLSERTIETHRQNIFEKTRSKNAVGLAVYAMRTGIVE